MAVKAPLLSEIQELSGPAGEIKLYLSETSRRFVQWVPSGRVLLQLPCARESREWVNEQEWTITSHERHLRSPWDVSIFRVPNFLKQSTKRGAYVPKIVSLGPYHHSNEHPFPMDKHKGRALRRMMARFNINHAKDPTDKEFFFSAKDEILKLEDKIRKTYEEKIECDAEILALMLIEDGCFILEILRTLGGEIFPVMESGNCYEPIFERNKIDYTGFDILTDILMLENQIPLIVLRKLLELELNRLDKVGTKLFRVLVKSPSSKFYPFKYDVDTWSWPQQQFSHPQVQEQQVADEEQAHHLLALLHALIVSPHHLDLDHAYHTEPGTPNRASNAVRRIPRAVELRNAGIKFESSLGGIKEIKFEQKSGTIYLPPIQITDYTEVLFRNLIALELCKASEINYVTCYLSLMDQLIDSEEDVGLLRKSEIVTNYLGSDAAVAELLNALCNGVTLSQTDAFQELKGQVYKHYKSKFKVWLAELVKEHFSSPWTTLALAGAILALLLTALQTIFTIISVLYK
ncbi:hypothetical protein SUGI_1049700 [Cryptomeria japonica]|uniref:putative UPF0481 protein At3g02645 n=1 Tax=Cryptomeria japonica TaxID=3369 RepID=UPI0024146AD5|nr:putative UPF0481 protein At3g02645 [Cryptomeria japonica]GLJ49528.1 hypothetical protein SUGI_1049700 [Cryptomeria japonica]